jgi:short-subunit dehydrogenase
VNLSEFEKMENIVITGASTGIGYGATQYLIEKGYHVFGSVRKQEDADRLQKDFGEQFTPLIFDVSDEAGIKEAAAQVKSAIGNQGLSALVNNAGITIMGPLMHLPIEKMRFQLEVNVIGVLAVTQAFLPLLGAAKEATSPPGRVINISSISGKIAYPFMGAYAASKHAVEALSDSLRRELMLYGIDVIIIQPGIVKTPILEKGGEQLNIFKETDYAPIMEKAGPMMIERSKTGMSVETLAATIYQALSSKKPKTRYTLPIKWLSRWFLPRFLPTRMIDNMSAKQFGLLKKL